MVEMMVALMAVHWVDKSVAGSVDQLVGEMVEMMAALSIDDMDEITAALSDDQMVEMMAALMAVHLVV